MRTPAGGMSRWWCTNVNRVQPMMLRLEHKFPTSRVVMITGRLTVHGHDAGEVIALAAALLHTLRNIT